MWERRNEVGFGPPASLWPLLWALGIGMGRETIWQDGYEAERGREAGQKHVGDGHTHSSCYNTAWAVN